MPPHQRHHPSLPSAFLLRKQYKAFLTVYMRRPQKMDGAGTTITSLPRYGQLWTFYSETLLGGIYI